MCSVRHSSEVAGGGTAKAEPAKRYKRDMVDGGDVWILTKDSILGFSLKMMLLKIMPLKIVPLKVISGPKQKQVRNQKESPAVSGKPTQDLKASSRRKGTS
jgi:hypothetical protein